MIFSVIICTHNPNRDYLQRTLNALSMQTLRRDEWELLLIDNASEPAINKWIDLSWHPYHKIVLEPRLGKIWAYLAGINQVAGEFVVIVDDDNLLAPDYLEKALSIARSNPYIGAFGGNLNGEFENEPPAWIIPYLDMIAVRNVNRDCWSNMYIWSSTPAGAGLVIRSEIARQFAWNVRNNPVRQLLDRKGRDTMSAGDVDLAFTAIDMGFGCGLFRELNLTHIIPDFRLTRKYFFRLYEGILVSQYLLDSVRIANYKISFRSGLIQFSLAIYRLFFKSSLEFRMTLIERKAKWKALKILKENTNNIA